MTNVPGLAARSWLDGAAVLVCGTDEQRVRAILRELTQAGARVILPTPVSEPRAWPEVSSPAEEFSGSAFEVEGDVRSLAGIEAFVQQCLRTTGRIDGLVCDVPPIEPLHLEGIEEPAWSEGLRNALKLPFFLARCVGLAMAAARQGRIVIVAEETPSISHDGILGSVIGPARVMMVRVLSKALAPDVSVRVVAAEAGDAAGVRRPGVNEGPDWQCVSAPALLARRVREALEAEGR